MTTAHTPGPWTPGATATLHDGRPIYSATGVCIAMCPLGRGGFDAAADETDANARLIAAAPALAAALRQCVGCLVPAGGGCTTLTEAYDRGEAAREAEGAALAAARAALRLVEGD